jgi:soluble lytic murein transglycosylase-like protein
MTRNQILALVAVGAAVVAAKAYAGTTVTDFDMEKLLDVIRQIESGGNANAVNQKSGARGPYQFMAVTWKDVWERILKTPENADFDLAFNETYSRQAAKAYFGWMATYLKKKSLYSLDNLAAAYNSGPTNVIKYRGVPPFKETKDYVAKMRKLMGV